MRQSKYNDITAATQVIGSIYANPKLLENEKYTFHQEDFVDDLHRIVFGSIYNLWQLGSTEITLATIEDYLTQRPKSFAIYKDNKGAEFLLKCTDNAQHDAFPYYYQRLKKFTLFRAYESAGLNLDDFYDPDNIFDAAKKQKQEDWFDNTAIDKMADDINDKIEVIKTKYVEGFNEEATNLGKGAFLLLEKLKEKPSYGYPLFDTYWSTVVRGARFGKYYLRSAATGVGKSRSMIADACYIGCYQMYDQTTQTWVSTGAAQPTLFIATEQDKDEVTSMAIAFLAAVDEEHILRGHYEGDEWERVTKAAEILADSKVFFECIPDFSMKDIENAIKQNIRVNHTAYCFFDYIHSSAKILMEVGGNSGVKNLREDNILFLMSSKLKEIAIKYNVFMMSSTQLNGEWKDSEVPDQNLLRGSKAIADRIDFGGILMDVTKTDIEKLKNISGWDYAGVPNVKMSCYKNRQGRYRGIYLWMVADKSTCRFKSVFVTDFNYNLIEFQPIKIKVNEESGF